MVRVCPLAVTAFVAAVPAATALVMAINFLRFIKAGRVQYRDRIVKQRLIRKSAEVGIMGSVLYDEYLREILYGLLTEHL